MHLPSFALLGLLVTLTTNVGAFMPHTVAGNRRVKTSLAFGNYLDNLSAPQPEERGSKPEPSKSSFSPYKKGPSGNVAKSGGPTNPYAPPPPPTNPYASTTITNPYAPQQQKETKVGATLQMEKPVAPPPPPVPEEVVVEQVVETVAAAVPESYPSVVVEQKSFGNQEAKIEYEPEADYFEEWIPPPRPYPVEILSAYAAMRTWGTSEDDISERVSKDVIIFPGLGKCGHVPQLCYFPTPEGGVFLKASSINVSLTERSLMTYSPLAPSFEPIGDAKYSNWLAEERKEHREQRNVSRDAIMERSMGPYTKYGVDIK